MNRCIKIPEAAFPNHFKVNLYLSLASTKSQKSSTKENQSTIENNF